MRHTRYIFIALALGALLSGCSAVKECKAPQLDMPQAFSAAESRTADSLTLADIDWFEFYSDPLLKSVLTAVVENNRDLLGAAARVDELRELYGASKTDLMPQLDGRVYGNQETNHYHDKAYLRDPEYGVKATLSWEADLWGNLRWGKRGSHASYLASVEDCRAMQMVVIAEAASAYFRLVSLDNELDIVRRTVETRAEELAKAKLRFEGGLTSEIVYQQARVEYNTAASLIPGLEHSIAVCESGLNLLMGRYAGEPVARRDQMLDTIPADALPVGLPTELLTRRPDLRAGELRLKKAMADVGVAYTDRFPRLTFGLTGGVENDDITSLFKSPFSFISGALAGPIFDFGKRKRQYKSKIAAYDRARLSYEQTVLTAVKEVDDAVVAYRKAREATASKSELLRAATRYMELAHLQYRAGSISYLDVLDAQRRCFDARIGLSNAVRDERLTLVELYRSLGGGWSRQAS